MLLKQWKPKFSKEVMLNLFFCFVAIAGQVGQNITLPLWLSSSTVKSGNCSSKLDDSEKQEMFDNGTNGNGTDCGSRTIDAYFVYTFACISFVLIFGIMLIIMKIICPLSVRKRDLKHPQYNLFLIGFFDGLNGVLAVFASNPERTAPYLQAILGNFTIPLTVVFRIALLRKKPSKLQALCSCIIFLSIFLCLLPAFVPSLGGKFDGGAKGASAVIWPLIFMIAFVPAAVMNVLEEKVLKTEGNGLEHINMIYFFFATSCYQLLTAAGFFWADIIPWYGFSKTVQQLGQNWAFGASCFFGGEGCGVSSGLTGAMFIIFYTISYLGGGLLLRFAEGATYLAVVSALVTPLGFIFWTLFQTEPFAFDPSASNQTWFAIASVVLMFPAIFFYNYKKERQPLYEDRRLLINKSFADYNVQDQFRDIGSHHVNN